MKSQKSLVKVLSIFVLSVFMVLTYCTDRVEAFKTCKDLLDNKLYRCSVKTPITPPGEVGFESCFQFANPGTNASFELVVDPDSVAPITTACTCEATGSFNKPKFDRLKNFYCVSIHSTDVGNSFGISFKGKATAKGKKIKKGQAINDGGGSFVLQCVEDPSCTTAAPMTVNQEENGAGSNWE